jgi:methionyl-tRNA formyltransferase
MRIGWVGFHMEGVSALRALLERGIHLEGVLTLPPELGSKKSGAADYKSLCAESGVALYEIANINDAQSIALLKRLSLDLAFVIGWTQIVRHEALALVRVGMIGAHASLLPHHRGRAPINWALIKGAQRTGNTLIWLSDEVDAGAIIDQTEIPITPYDSCGSLYEKVAETNRDMILRALPRLLAGERPGRLQRPIDEPNLPGRKPEDGRIDWSQDSNDLYNFVRALTRPYPGAFGWLEGKRWTIWECASLPGQPYGARTSPGQVIGPMYSPEHAACGQVIACGTGAVVALELEGEDGQILRGPQLSEQRWNGKVWTNAS